MLIDFSDPPRVGLMIPTLHGQQLRLDRVQPHKTLAGTPSHILHWSAACVDCEARYTFTSGLAFDAAKRPRRCEPCLLGRFAGATGNDRTLAARAHYGESQKRSYADAKAVRAGTLALAPKALKSVTLNEGCDGLRCEFSFNDRRKRKAFYRDGAVKCSEARGCDFSPFVPALERLLAYEIEKALF